MTENQDYARLRAASVATQSIPDITKLESAIEADVKKVLQFIASRDAKLIHKACKGIGKVLFSAE